MRNMHQSGVLEMNRVPLESDPLPFVWPESTPFWLYRVFLAGVIERVKSTTKDIHALKRWDEARFEPCCGPALVGGPCQSLLLDLCTALKDSPVL